MAENQKHSPPASPDSPCLVRAVREAMAADPTLEAVRIDRDRQSVSVATLGKPRHENLAEAVSGEIQQLEAAGGHASCELLRGAQSCSQCAENPQSAVPTRPLQIRQEGPTTLIARVTCPTAQRFWRWREVPLPRIVSREVVFSGEEDYDREWRQQLVAAVLCGLFALAAWIVPRAEVAFWLYPLAYVAGAWFTVGEVRERLRDGVLDIHFLMLAVAAGSASIGAWAEGAILLFLFSFSGALEHYALGRTQREIRSLFRAAPKTATRVDEFGREVPTAVDQLRPGMRLLIRPGELFPVDAEIRRGQTASDESTLTGEAVPVEKRVGDLVLAGTLNLWGGVEVDVKRPASESALQQVIRLIQEAQRFKAPSQQFTDRFGTRYTVAVLGLCVGMFFVWWLAIGCPPFVSAPGQASAFYRTMTLLVVTSPCALVLSIPSAVLAAIAWGARRGVLFRGGAAVEKLAEVDVVAMDKTGTLTTGELQVERIESFPPGRESAVAELAYSLERMSTHPLARALVRHGKQHGLRVCQLEDFQSLPGLGVQARWRGQDVRLGRREWLGGAIDAGVCAQVGPVDTAHSEIWLTGDGLVGRVLLRDDLRPAARGVIAALRELGLRILVLTGDRRAAAEQLRAEAGVQEIRPELKPEEKVEIIRDLTREGHRVAMIGDGVNDAPSLAAAHVGVAMGARGADAALEQAEVVLMHDRIENVLAAYQLSRRARRIIRQNLTLSLGTVVVLAAMALVGTIPLTFGVLGHEGSTVIVVLNSLRLLFTRPPVAASAGPAQA